jgi:hypothetical protein
MNILLIAAKSLFSYATDNTFAYMFQLSPNNVNHYLRSTSEVYIIYTIYLSIIESYYKVFDTFVLDVSSDC